jgi:hypothetical protein
MTPQEVAAQVERLDQHLSELRQELAVDRRAFSHWAISVAVGHLLFSLALFLGIANASKTNVEFIWIFVMSAIVTLCVGLSILLALVSTRRLRRAWLGSGKGQAEFALVNTWRLRRAWLGSGQGKAE